MRVLMIYLSSIFIAAMISAVRAEAPFSGPTVIASGFGEARWVYAADFNGDGFEDIALAVHLDEVTLFESNGDGTFVERPIADNTDSPQGVWAGDINGDGLLDITAADHEGDQETWYENLGTEPITFSEHTVGPPTLTHLVAAVPADLDSDGNLDLVLAAQSPINQVLWSRNLG